MGDELHFSSNYRDQCIQSGTGAGFQFEFYCQSCNDTWRSPFEPYRSGQASGWVQEASGFLGGLLGGAGYELNRAADGLAQAGWGTSRDAAFKRAIAAAEAHFHRCARCRNYVCDPCWDQDRGLCRRCVPDLAAEVETARHAGAMDAAVEAARRAGAALGETMDVGSERQLVCTGCGAETHGGRFCPQCGQRIDVPAQCGGCGEALPAGSRFCPQCGQAAGGG